MQIRKACAVRYTITHIPRHCLWLDLLSWRGHDELLADLVVSPPVVHCVHETT